LHSISVVQIVAEMCGCSRPARAAAVRSRLRVQESKQMCSRQLFTQVRLQDADARQDLTCLLVSDVRLRCHITACVRAVSRLPFSRRKAVTKSTPPQTRFEKQLTNWVQLWPTNKLRNDGLSAEQKHLVQRLMARSVLISWSPMAARGPQHLRTTP
jgi:hypothetical protein